MSPKISEIQKTIFSPISQTFSAITAPICTALNALRSANFSCSSTKEFKVQRDHSNSSLLMRGMKVACLILVMRADPLKGQSYTMTNSSIPLLQGTQETPFSLTATISDLCPPSRNNPSSVTIVEKDQNPSLDLVLNQIPMKILNTAYFPTISSSTWTEDYGYVVCQDGYLYTIDTSYPPKAVASTSLFDLINAGISADAASLFTTKNYLYLLAPLGYFVKYDISNPLRPVLISITQPVVSPDTLREIFLGSQSDYGLMMIQSSTGTYLKSFSISDPSSSTIANITLPYSIVTILLEKDFAYLPLGSYGLGIIYLQNSTVLHQFNVTNPILFCATLIIFNNTLIISGAHGTTEGLFAVDVMNPLDPLFLGSASTIPILLIAPFKNTIYGRDAIFLYELYINNSTDIYISNSVNTPFIMSNLYINDNYIITATQNPWSEDDAVVTGLTTFSRGSQFTLSGTINANAKSNYSFEIVSIDSNNKPYGSSIPFNININPVIVVQDEIPPQLAVVGSFFNYNLPAGQFKHLNGNSLSYSAVQANGDLLPTGLTINSVTGALSGTFSASGVYFIRLLVTDQLGASAYTDFSLSVVYPITAINPNLPSETAVVGVPFNKTFSSLFSDLGNVKLNYSVTSNGFPLPSWLAENNLNFEGAPTTAGTTLVNIQAMDSNGQTSTVVFSINAQNVLPPTINNPLPILTANVGVDFSYTLPRDYALSTIGGTVTYIVYNLPSWATFDPDELRIYGTPESTDQSLVGVRQYQIFVLSTVSFPDSNVKSSITSTLQLTLEGNSTLKNAGTYFGYASLGFSILLATYRLWIRTKNNYFKDYPQFKKEAIIDRPFSHAFSLERGRINLVKILFSVESKGCLSRTVKIINFLSCRYINLGWILDNYSEYTLPIEGFSYQPIQNRVDTAAVADFSSVSSIFLIRAYKERPLYLGAHILEEIEVTILSGKEMQDFATHSNMHLERRSKALKVGDSSL